MKNITILGSTGSIGTQALSVARLHNINIKGLSCNNNTKLLEEQSREFSPNIVCIGDEKKYKDLKLSLADTNIKVVAGKDGLLEIARENADVCLNGVVGIAGLLPTLEALSCGIDVALANKESLVTGGALVTKLATEKNANLIPVDSEHSAIFQCLQGNSYKSIKKIILTASGGPFFGKDRAFLKTVTVKDALKHPNWAMGSKITIDSATLMNKGLEFIEAIWLFDLKPEQIEVVVHRQSVLHSAVEFTDNSVIGQMGVPDMKIPIQYALTYPERFVCDVKPLSFTDYGTLTFEKPDIETFRCLKGCIKAIEIGGTLPAFINGVNEKAVEYFLAEKISFLKIGELIEKGISDYKWKNVENINDILTADKEAREFVALNI